MNLLFYWMKKKTLLLKKAADLMIKAESQNLEDSEKIENILSKQIIAAAIEVHHILGGPGLLENLYEDALYYELKLRNIPVQSQVQVPVVYKNYTVRDPMRLDLLVGDKVIIEVKATEKDHAIYKAQVLTYLRLTGLKLGLVINFGQSRLMDGLSKVVSNL